MRVRELELTFWSRRFNYEHGPRSIFMIQRERGECARIQHRLLD